jgi:tetratricopeptide (TPR) repeat protein
MRLFVSYAGADTAWAEWIAWQLERAGHQAIVQAWDFRPGENFVFQMRRALDAAERTLAVMSTAYLESVYGSDEWTAAFIHDRPEAMGLLVVRVEEVALPRLLRPWIYVDLVGVDAQTAAQRLLEGLQAGRRKPALPPSFPQAAQSTRLPSFPGRGLAISNLPPRNPTFTGRDDLLARLHQQLGNEHGDGDSGRGGTLALMAGTLYGLGGVGKTQLAIEYAYRFASNYDLVWWIPAENPLTIPAGLARLAPQLGLPPLADQEELAAAVLDTLRTRDRWLLVFDNAQQPEDLARWRPSGDPGRVLVTSRNPAWRAVATPIQVDVLDRAEAIALLLRRTPDRDQAAAAQLAEELGDLPLALEQAAAYLEQTGMPLAAYLAAYRRRRGQLLAKGHPIAYHGQVDTTWQLSIDRLAEQVPAGIELLRLCAFLAPEAIPLDLFTALPEPDRLPTALAALVREDRETGVQEAAGACYRYSLVSRDLTGIRVHRLVQQVTRDGSPDASNHALVVTTVELLNAAHPAEGLGDPTHWPRCAQLLPHVLAAADHADTAAVATATTATLLRHAGTYLSGRGEYRAARGLLERALTLAETAHGPNDLQVSHAHSELGLVLRASGDLERARVHHERALVMRQTALGFDHPEVGATLNNLAIVLREQGEVDGACAYHKRALALVQAAYGPNHTEVAFVLDNFGNTLDVKGDLAGARAHHERALAIKQATYGPDHPQVAITLGCLGSTVFEQGDLAVARSHLERALAIKETTLGPNHPEVAATSWQLARVLQAQGDLAATRMHLDRAFAIWHDVVGPDHPHTQAVAQALSDL